MIPFDRLVLELKDRVLQESGIPSEGQYHAAVRSGVARFNTDAGMIKYGTLAVVAGTDSYTLPTGFLKMIHMDSMRHGSAFVQPGGLLMPLPASGLSETITIYGDTLQIRPTPQYTLDRSYTYKAAHVLTGDDYPDMGEEEAYIILLEAQAELMRRSLTTKADKALRYSFGDVTIDTGRTGASIVGAIKALDEAYLERLKSFRGPMAVRADYDLVDHANYAGRLIV